tara:strand:+ start:672 stop:920 length:249 start_codon:yes stop_codon:yes gene_type:complete
MTHLEDHPTDELNEHLTRLQNEIKKIQDKIENTKDKSKIKELEKEIMNFSYRLKVRNGKIIFIDTKDKQLIDYAKAQNKDLK